MTAYLKTNYVGCTRLADLLIMNPDDLADELRACVKNYGDLLRVAYAPSAAAVMLGSPADGDAYWEAVRRLGFPPERWAERPFLPVNQPSAAGAVPAVGRFSGAAINVLADLIRAHASEDRELPDDLLPNPSLLEAALAQYLAVLRAFEAHRAPLGAAGADVRLTRIAFEAAAPLANFYLAIGPDGSGEAIVRSMLDSYDTQTAELANAVDKVLQAMERQWFHAFSFTQVAELIHSGGELPPETSQGRVLDELRARHLEERPVGRLGACSGDQEYSELQLLVDSKDRPMPPTAALLLKEAAKPEGVAESGIDYCYRLELVDPSWTTRNNNQGDKTYLQEYRRLRITIVARLATPEGPVELARRVWTTLSRPWRAHREYQSCTLIDSPRIRPEPVAYRLADMRIARRFCTVLPREIRRAYEQDGTLPNNYSLYRGPTYTPTKTLEQVLGAGLVKVAQDGGMEPDRAGLIKAAELLRQLYDIRARQSADFIFGEVLGGRATSTVDDDGLEGASDLEKAADRLYLARALLFTTLRLSVPDVFERSDAISVAYLGEPHRRLLDPWALAQLGAHWQAQGEPIGRTGERLAAQIRTRSAAFRGELARLLAETRERPGLRSLDLLLAEFELLAQVHRGTREAEQTSFLPDAGAEPPR